MHKLNLHTMAYMLYASARGVTRKLGLTNAVRGALSPIAGRFIFWLATKSDRISINHGHKMLLASGDGYPPLDMAMGRYEPGTTRLFEEVVKPGMAVIDIGAHVGYYTLLAARQVGPTGRVFAFEPDQVNHELLQKNIRLNYYENVEVARIAVSDRVGWSPLYLTALDSGRNSMYHHGLRERGSVIVETTTIDSFLESKDWPRVDLIKIDVEGAELTVLDGMTQLLRRSDELKMIVEFNPALLQNAGVAPLQFLERLASPGWDVYLIDDVNGLLPLAPGDARSFADRLLATQDSANLFCTRE